jgi:uncharacterized membrane protein
MASREVPPNRLQSFSDGVFAIIITILVLELRAPSGGHWKDLFQLWPEAASYAVSYLFIAIVWVNHHHLLSYADRTTPRLIWVNFAHLFTVSLLPFTTAWVARTDIDGVPVFTYAAVFMLVNASYIWLCNELVDRSGKATEGAKKMMRMRSVLTLVVFGIGGLVALWHSLVGFGVICACLITYLRPETTGAPDDNT